MSSIVSDEYCIYDLEHLETIDEGEEFDIINLETWWELKIQK